MKYEATDFRSFRIDEDGSTELMANFVAEITKEVRVVDGMTSRSVLTVAGTMPNATNPDDLENPQQLPPVEVPAEDFPGLGWIMPAWGVRCIVRPGSGIKDDLRTMIQLQSKPEITTIFKQTGWEMVNGQRTFLHTGGGITRKGNDPSVQVRMPPELSRFDLTTSVPPAEGVAATLALLTLARSDLIWPLIAGTLTPLYGSVDFAIHLTGRTGSFKSELMSLFQSHYGAGMDARKLPGTWASTPNALEALAFFARNAPFVIDDFVPAGTSWQQRAYQQNADKIIRAQGNQAGRARLTDTSTMQQTMYPRGIILSTGEDTPEGHSVRARMLILEVAAGEIEAPKLTRAQANRPKYSATVAWLAQQLAAEPTDLTPRMEQLRAAYRDIGHSRTPGMIGRLVATCEDFLTKCAAAGFISEQQRKQLTSQAKVSMEKAGASQQAFLEDSDPVDVFQAAIRQVFASGLGHVRSLNGGVPTNATLVGWTSENSIGEMQSYKARGPCIGWVKVPADELYLDITAGYALVKKVAGADLALSKQTLFKRLKDSGILKRVDDGRQRNTVRVTAENHPRQVICLSLSSTLDQEDMSDGNDDGTGDGEE